jgi:hypothetical protein
MFLPSTIWSNGKVPFWGPLLKKGVQKAAPQLQNLDLNSDGPFETGAKLR